MTNFNLLLLQVLEYLAMREILTLEHINGGPPCAGRERLENIAEFCLVNMLFSLFYSLFLKTMLSHAALGSQCCH